MKHKMAVKALVAIAICFCTFAVHADEPSLEISILEEQGGVDLRKPFKVEFANRSDHAVTIYDPRSAEGFRALSLVFTHKKTKKEQIAGPKEQVANSERSHRFATSMPMPERRAKLLECNTNTLTIEGEEQFRFYVFFGETVESERPDLDQIAEWDLQVLYETRANSDKAWNGRILSKPLQGKLYCSGLEDLKTAIKLSEPATLKLLENNPQWLNSLGKQEILKLAISHSRPEIVR